MQEKELRKWHRNVAIVFVIFIIVQALTGLLITLGEMGTPHSNAREEAQVQVNENDMAQPEEASSLEGILGFIHHGGGLVGAVYRTILGIGMLWIAGTGFLIYMKIRARRQAVKVRGR